MKSRETNGQEEQMGTQLEKKEGISSVIGILREAAQQFKVLWDESDKALLEEKDARKSLERLKQRAQILVDLPNRLSPVLEGLQEPWREKVREEISDFAETAQRVLAANNDFGMSVLLVNKGSKQGEKNELEKLIASLERSAKNKTSAIL